MSALEDELARQVTEAGLPPFLRQLRFSPPRRWAWDIAFLPHKVAVEVDGGTQTRPRKIGARWYQLVSGHTSTTGIRNDCEKRNEAEIQGWLCLRMTKDMIEEGVALTQIKRALKSREEQ